MFSCRTFKKKVSFLCQMGSSTKILKRNLVFLGKWSSGLETHKRKSFVWKESPKKVMACSVGLLLINPNW